MYMMVSCLLVVIVALGIWNYHTVKKSKAIIKNKDEQIKSWIGDYVTVKTRLDVVCILCSMYKIYSVRELETEYQVIGWRNKKDPDVVVVKSFSFDLHDDADKDFAFREAEELAEILNEE